MQASHYISKDNAQSAHVMPLPRPSLPLPRRLLHHPRNARSAIANAAFLAAPIRRGAGAGALLPPSPLVATFSASRSLALKKHQMPPRPKPPPDSEIEESYLKGSGPGGQKINKTSSAVQLKHVPTGVVVKSQATRSRSQNRKIARELLAQKLDDMLNGDQSRSAIVGEVKRKKAASAAKKSRRKYRQLEEERGEGTDHLEEFQADVGEKQVNIPNEQHPDEQRPDEQRPDEQRPER